MVEKLSNGSGERRLSFVAARYAAALTEILKLIDAVWFTDASPAIKKIAIVSMAAHTFSVESQIPGPLRLLAMQPDFQPSLGIVLPMCDDKGAAFEDELDQDSGSGLQGNTLLTARATSADFYVTGYTDCTRQ